MLKSQIVLIVSTIFLQCSCQEYVTLETKQGVLNGTVKYNRKNGTFYSYQRIPYGKPPVGDLRFKEPLTSDKWDGILDATKDLPQCYQGDSSGNVFGQEDCLYLNVYTPQAPTNSYDGYKDVMVFIYGGGFLRNSGRQDLYSPEFLLAEDIVLVTINYRLGIFGSFNLNDTSFGYPGNLGLKDQSLAFKWVKSNIENFGGKMDSITIFGESAGAVSVHYHILSPLSAGTFHKAIIESGTAISPWTRGVHNNGVLLAEILGISTENITAIVDKLLQLTGDKIYMGQQKLMQQVTPRWGTINYPIVEQKISGQNSFLTKAPLSLIQNGDYYHVPIMVGYNNAEGISYQSRYSSLINLVPGDLELEDESGEAIDLLREMKNFYFNGSEPSLDDKQSLIQIYTDVWFRYPAYRLATEHRKTTNSSIYFYRFSADTNLNVYKLKKNLTKSYSGATHADELGYLFLTHYHKIFTPEVVPDSVEDKAIDRVVKLWTNFAKYGNPTPNAFGKIQWEPITSEILNYVDIGTTKTIPGINPDTENVQFWSDVYAKYSKSNL